MSTTNTVTVWCDHGYDRTTGHRQCHQWYAGPEGTAKAARRTARQQGWRYVPGHPATGPGRDLCPIHATRAVSAAPETTQEN